MSAVNSMLSSEEDLWIFGTLQRPPPAEQLCRQQPGGHQHWQAACGWDQPWVCALGWVSSLTRSYEVTEDWSVCCWACLWVGVFASQGQAAACCS
jgi:hypothetical protein